MLATAAGRVAVGSVVVVAAAAAAAVDVDVVVEERAEAC